MQTRHRVPTIFNIYMLDVICCALGCVILLWQVSHQEAEQQTAAAAQARENYERASQEVLSATGEAGQLKRDLAASETKSRQLADELAKSRALAAARLRDHEQALAALERKEDALKRLQAALAELQEKSSAELASKDKVSTTLRTQLAAAERKVSDLEKEIAAQMTASEKAALKLAEQLALLQRSEGRNKKLEQQASDLSEQGRETRDKLTLAELRAKLLEQELERSKKDLADNSQRFKDLLATHDRVSKQLVDSARELGQAKATLAILETDKTKRESEASKLLARAREMQAAAEQRFAGIELTGENVIFLIDMSGSMALLDSQTAAPDKWPKVCEVIARLMHSLTGLQRYQVILFSDRVRYLFGHDGQWLKYDPKSSAQVTMDTLKRVKPEGETNLHAAFSETFRYRSLGLDTIYLLSDGLPNAGEGVPANFAQWTEAQKSEYLSRSLRQRLKTDWNRPLTERLRVRIHTIGFFFESPDVGAFLWALAREHDGSFVGMSKP
jgi:hypothetical protein